MKKFFTLLAAVLVATFALTGCSNTSTEKMSTANATDSQSVITALEHAKVIKLKKDFISFGDKWTVTVDDVQVATIEGRPFYLIGDTYSMYSKAGNFVGAETEQLRLINHKSDLYDFNGKQTGAIEQQVISLLYKFKFKDVAGQQVGEMNQNFSLSLSGDIKTMSGEKAWSFKKDLISLGASIKVTREAESDIPAINAVWMAVIANEISESSSKSSK